MNAPQETRTVQITRHFDAPIELVYEAWTQREHISNWMKCNSEATMDVHSWEATPGATFSYRMAKEGEFEVNATGRVLEAEAPRVFCYCIDAAPELGAPELTIRVELAEIDGGTELTLTHSGLPNEQFCGIVEGGWGVSLELLKDVLVTLVGAYASVRMAKGGEKKSESEEKK